MAFQESQKISKGLRLLVIITTLPAIVLVANKLVKEPDNTEALYGLLTLITMSGGLYFLLLNGTAHIRVDTQGVHYKYFPFVRNWKIIAWQEVDKIYVKAISPLTDFGGWGYRFGPKKKGIILSGDHAIYIELKTGKHFVVTTKMPELAKKEIEHLQERKL